MIDLRAVHFDYRNGEDGCGLSGIDLHASAGEVIVVTGPSGCGKSTLTRLVNGLIPHFFHGPLRGEVTVAGRVMAQTPPAEAADMIGSVFQNPRSQFFTVDVGSELAFAAENLGHERDLILQRVREAAQELGLDSLLDRSIFDLSGGQKQKLACGSVWVARPHVLVLDEPSANLDATTLDDLRDLILDWKRAGRTVLVAEHRLAYLQGVADRWLVMERGRITREFTAAAMAALDAPGAAALGLRSPHPLPALRLDDPAPPQAEVVELTGFFTTYPGAAGPALDVPALTLPRHGIVAITGPNGAGKSTLSRALAGLDRRSRGLLTIDGSQRDRRARLATSFLVMQDVNHQLFTESVMEEVRLSAPEASPERLTHILRSLDLSAVAERHPMSLSGGQKQRVAIAAAVASDADVVIFDEPTSGLDRAHMSEVAARLAELVADGRLVVVVTHDDELVAACADHVVRLEAGKVTDSGPLSRVEVAF